VAVVCMFNSLDEVTAARAMLSVTRLLPTFTVKTDGIRPKNLRALAGAALAKMGAA